jgi:hypothetical protein
LREGVAASAITRRGLPRVKLRGLSVRKLKLLKTFGTTREPPMFNVATLTPILQTLLTTTAD